MASTYEITDQGGYTEVLLKEDAAIINRFAFSKSVSIRVRNGALEIYQGNKLVTPRIPRELVAIPASATDEDLFDNLSFMSENSGGGTANRGYDDVITFTVPAGGGFAIIIDSVSTNIGDTYLLESESIMKASSDSSGYASKVKSASMARYHDDGTGGVTLSGSPNSLPDPSISVVTQAPSSFLLISNGNIVYQVGVSALVPEAICTLYYSITKI